MFIGGGDTRAYHRIYTAPAVKAAIREMYAAGVPFGRVSAGALVSTESCTVWGSKVTTERNEYRLRAGSAADPAADGDAPLALGRGLGLLQDCIVETHSAERGGFPRLVQAMEVTGSTHGLGIDEGICLESRDGTAVAVHGQGRAYCLKRSGPLRFELVVREPGDGFTLAKRFFCRVLDAASANGTAVWLYGGYALDAYAGRRRREHQDVDSIARFGEWPAIEHACPCPPRYPQPLPVQGD